uniref:hypothetical protein n=1 Tax=Rhodococcus sp. MTM3W5.2 TaxID=1805827 RepID=UPI0016798A9D|nr:hypothetical protein [Rhodococcus sp. MTM3W5.2]
MTFPVRTGQETSHSARRFIMLGLAGAALGLGFALLISDRNIKYNIEELAA